MRSCAGCPVRNRCRRVCAVAVWSWVPLWCCLEGVVESDSRLDGSCGCVKVGCSESERLEGKCLGKFKSNSRPVLRDQPPIQLGSLNAFLHRSNPAFAARADVQCRCDNLEKLCVGRDMFTVRAELIRSHTKELKHTHSDCARPFCRSRFGGSTKSSPLVAHNPASPTNRSPGVGTSRVPSAALSGQSSPDRTR
jgi:hypothetical protein